MTELPSGTVTFLFTDIEGSTSLLKHLGRDRYDEVLATHGRLLRAAFAAHDGRVVDTQGDSFFVAFRTAADAVAAAADTQRELAAQAWPGGVEVKVRMGVHTGEPKVGEERYVGIGVHRAARIGAAGHGGQVLLSSTSKELAEEDLPPGVSIRDLGERRQQQLQPRLLLGADGLPGLPADLRLHEPHNPLHSQPLGHPRDQQVPRDTHGSSTRRFVQTLEGTLYHLPT